MIVLSAHLDHLGVNEALTGDKIFNGADDDASGCVAVLEMARVFASSARRPRRTIYFVCFGSEESGGYGSRYFIANSIVPSHRSSRTSTSKCSAGPIRKCRRQRCG